ncbi:hypothetical protein CHUAL_008990 [Chamberlinius hualienensis]
MAPTWRHYGIIKVPKNHFYKQIVVLNENIYLLGIESKNPLKGLVSKMDLKTLKITPIMPIEYERALSHDRYTTMCVYADSTLLIGPFYSSSSINLLMINTITHQKIDLNIDFQSDCLDIIDQYVIEDHIYIILHSGLKSELSILVVNLENFKKKVFVNSNQCFKGYGIFSTAAHKCRIYCFNHQNSAIFIFNTVNNNWNEIFSSRAKVYDKESTYQNILMKDEVVSFKMAFKPYFRKWIEILDFRRMQWRIPNFSYHSQSDWTFTKYFTFNGKIFIIKNSPNVIKEYSLLHSKLEDSDELEIYVLNLNPSLKSLCAARILELNLDQSKLPKKLQVMDLCVIMDHLYIILFHHSEDALSILSINLHTFEITGPFYGANRRYLREVKMCPLWYHLETRKASNKVIYELVVINERICMVGLNFYQRFQEVIYKPDLNLPQVPAVKCRKVSPNYIYSKMCGYGNYGVFLMPFPKDNCYKLCMIHRITNEVNTININYNIDWYSKELCVIEDHVYIIWLQRSQYALSILSINLNTLEITGTFTVTSRQYLRDYPNLTVVPIGSEIYCFLPMKPFMFVFNTENNEWREIRNSLNEPYINHIIYHKIIINDELVAFKRTTNWQWIEIFNFQTMKWRIPNYSPHPQYDSETFSNYCELKGKIFIIKNSPSAARGYSTEPINPETIYDIEIYVLDLNPSLESLCAAKVIQLNLDRSILPKILQDELKRYIK